MNLRAIRETRAERVGTMRAMLAKAEAEKRNLNEGERKAFEGLKGEVTELEAQEQRAAFLADAERNMQGEPVAGEGDNFATLEKRVSLQNVIRAGVEGRALEGAEREYSAEAERRSGRKAQGAFVPMSALETRVNTTGGAGEIVPTDHRADQYIEPLRNKLLARRLGVRVLSGLTGDVSIPKYGSGTTSGWVAENSALTTSDMSFAAVTLSPKHVGALSEMSRQLIQQSSPDIEDLLRADMAFGIAQAIDSALIQGGGSNQPTGILKTTGIGTASLSTLNWAGILGMLETLDLANATAANFLTSPQAATKLRATLKSSSAGASYLMEGGRVAEIPASVTNQVPVKGTSTKTGILILGDFAQALLGVWSELDILVNPYAETAYQKGNVQVRAMATCDVAVRHPEAFVVATDISLA